MRPRWCVLFDVDGTLCDTDEVDGRCYREAAGVALGLPPEHIDWSEAPDRTDSGIARWLWTVFRKRAPTSEEQLLLRRDFVERLRSELLLRPSRFGCIPGAPRLVRELSDSGIPTGIGTGGWRPSAELKLTAAGLDASILHATADDHETRTAIFSLARLRTAGTAWKGRTLLIGDSVWDVDTARRLEWGFLGVGSGAAAEALRSAGAARVIPDYQGIDWRHIETLMEDGELKASL
jgi:phosphoglycolate phosphatase-like HAD superfamily hydrolase